MRGSSPSRCLAVRRRSVRPAGRANGRFNRIRGPQVVVARGFAAAGESIVLTKNAVSQPAGGHHAALLSELTGGIDESLDELLARLVPVS